MKSGPVRRFHVEKDGEERGAIDLDTGIHARVCETGIASANRRGYANERLNGPFGGTKSSFESAKMTR